MCSIFRSYVKLRGSIQKLSKSHDLFGTNRTSPEIQVKADLTLKDASGGTVLHAAALMGLLDLLPYRMAGKKGELVEVKFQFGKSFWKWDMMDLKMFRNYVFHLGSLCLFSYDVR